jgi:rubrerythrin
MAKVKDKGTKTMLQDLAGMEKKHERKLSDVKNGKGIKLAAGKVENLQLGEYMVENKLTEESGIQDVILFAIQCEKKAHQLYSDIGGVCSRGDERAFMASLANEELTHKNILEKAYDDIILKEN